MSKRSQLGRIENLLQRLDAAVVVRDPGSARAAEMYEGLRKQIIQSGKNHRMHLSHLIALQDSIERGADIELIRDRVNDYLIELGIQKTSDTSHIDSFEVVEGEGSNFECIEPAIVEVLDDGSIRTHQLGKARRVPGPIVEPIELTQTEPTELLEPELPALNFFSGLKKFLLILIVLLGGIRLGMTLFDKSDAPENKVSTTTIPTSTTSTTTG
jgi:hypothetical protein